MLEDHAPTVFVADASEKERAELRRLVQSVGLRVEPYRIADEFLARYDPEKPGCLVLEMRLPGMSGLELQLALSNRRLQVPIIFLTAHADVASTSQAMKNGAMDVFAKPYDKDLLIARVQHAIAKDLAARRDRAWRAQVAQRVATLSQREVQVLKYVLAGHPSKKAAAELQLSEKTIETYRSRILAKLQLPTFIDVVRTLTAAQVCSVGITCLACRGIPYHCPANPFQCSQLPGAPNPIRDMIEQANTGKRMT